MNIKTLFTDHKKGGNCYILKVDSKNKWCGFNKNIIDSLKAKFDDGFNIVLWGTKSEHDYYCIPFSQISHLFIEDRMTKGKLAEAGNKRWTATIVNHIFKMHANASYSVNIEAFYGLKSPTDALSYSLKDSVFGVDFSIEDARSVVNVRLGQSPFRKKVLDNFDCRCCLSGISETGLLIASHIVPWSLDKNYRADPSNGLCLFVEFDAYFDKGYISLDDDFRVIISPIVNNLDPLLKKRIFELGGRVISTPTKWDISLDHVRVHRTSVFKNE